MGFYNIELKVNNGSAKCCSRSHFLRRLSSGLANLASFLVFVNLFLDLIFC